MMCIHLDSTTIIRIMDQNSLVQFVFSRCHNSISVGWRKTVEQYFFGWNTSIDERGHVQSIITTSLESLLLNSERTFTYVESKFLHMWWKLATPEQRQSLHHVISTGQWIFVNGAWSMGDEAASHYMGLIDSATLGHAFLKDTLGVTPTIAWQLDPFGHSATQASLMTHKMGFDAIYFGRIDYQDLHLRRQAQECEGLWNPAQPYDGNHTTTTTTEDHAPIDPTVFWGLTGSYGGNYGAPDGFCFDVLCTDGWGVTPLMDLNETARHDKLHHFLELIAQQAHETKTNDILLTMGTDFTYSRAESYYANLDLLISSLMVGQEWNEWDVKAIFGGNSSGIDRVNIFYSNPEYYTQRKYQQTVSHAHERQKLQTERNSNGVAQEQRRNLKKRPRIENTKLASNESLWATKTDDFFPYSDCPHCFWTGYFTSRTSFKRLERVASGFLQAARQIGLLADMTTKNQHSSSAKGPALLTLEDSLGVSQHHDAITGTGKQHVADDYSKRLHAGLMDASNAVVDVVLDQLNASDTPLAETLQYCPLLNESICEPSLNHGDDDIYVVVYNPLCQGAKRNTTVRIPVSKGGIYVVKQLGDKESAVRSRSTQSFSGTRAAKVHEISITASLSCLSATAYVLSLDESEDDFPLEDRDSFLKFTETQVSVKNDHDMMVVFERSSGQLKKVSGELRSDGSFEVEIDLEEEWGYYLPYDHDLDKSDDAHENSGAYLFRPSTPNATLEVLVVRKDTVKFLPTDFGLEVHASYGHPNKLQEDPWLHRVVRVDKNHPWIEVDFTVGPVPIKDGRGKEVVSRLKALGIDNQGVFYTDSNGRAFLKRQRDRRPSWDMQVFEPVAGNYYPVNTAIYMEDANASLAILTDRSRGGGSSVDGSLELKIQRRTVVDDHRGVDEPLNETVGGMTPYPPYGDATRIGDGVVIRGTNRVMIGKGFSGASLARSVMDPIFSQPVVLVGSAPRRSTEGMLPSFSVLGATAQLPPNIYLATLLRLSEDVLLIRLGHQYGPDEDEMLSKPVPVNLAALLEPEYKVTNVVEKTLSGNRNWTDFVEKKYNWTSCIESNDETSRSVSAKKHDKKRSRDEIVTTVTLFPLDLRTFEVAVTAVPVDTRPY